MWKCSRFCSHRKICKVRGAQQHIRLVVHPCCVDLRPRWSIFSLPQELHYHFAESAANLLSLLRIVWCLLWQWSRTLWLFTGPAPPSHGPELELVLGRGGQHHGRGLCITAKWPRDEKETILHIPLADRGWEHFSFLRSRPIFIQHCTMWNLTLPNRTVPTSHSPSDQIQAIWSGFYEKENNLLKRVQTLQLSGGMWGFRPVPNAYNVQENNPVLINV